MIDIALQQPYALLLFIPLLTAAYLRYSQMEEISILHVTRFLIFAVLVLALAQPAVLTPYQTNERSLTVLNDNSDSSQLINYNKPQSGNVEINERAFSAQSPGGTTEAFLNMVEDDKNYIVSSDLQLEHQKLRDGLKDRNVSIYPLRQGMEDEHSVSIQGPSESYVGVDNRFDVEVSSTTDEKLEPEVTVNGEQVQLRSDSDGFYFNYTFDREGSNRITASISADDRYSSNNRYFHVVDVEQKPDVLYVNQRIQGPHNEFLDTEYAEQLPGSTERFDTVVANGETAGMEDRVIQGQNMLYTGPITQRNVLPLEPSGQQSDQSESFDMSRVAIVIDISVSNTEDIRNNKAIALNTLEGLSESSKVAVVAYNDEPYLLSELQTLQNNREELKNTIKSIETKGPTDHAVGVNAGIDVLNDRGNMVLITDGGLKTDAPGVENVRERTLRAAANSSVTINVVDSKPNVNPEFLQEVAGLTDGLYTSADSDGPLSFVFDSRTSSSQNKVGVVDGSHPVTADSEAVIFTEVAGAVEKQSAQTLMRSDSGTPYLSVWRYGIGRVAAINDKDPALNSLTTQNPQILLNTFQWLSSNRESQEVTVTGKRAPETTYISASESFEGSEQISRQRFVKSTSYNDTGFKTEAGRLFAYNYPRELQEIGYHENLPETANATGGQVIEPGSGIINRIASRKTATEGKDLENPLLALLAFLLLLEVGYRKRNRQI